MIASNSGLAKRSKLENELRKGRATTVSFSIPRNLADWLDDLGKKRGDTTFSATMRHVVLQGVLAIADPEVEEDDFSYSVEEAARIMKEWEEESPPEDHSDEYEGDTLIRKKPRDGE